MMMIFLDGLFLWFFDFDVEDECCVVWDDEFDFVCFVEECIDVLVSYVLVGLFDFDVCGMSVGLIDG